MAAVLAGLAILACASVMGGPAGAAGPAGASEIVVPLAIAPGDLTVTEVEGRHEITLRGAMTPLEAEPFLTGAAGGGNPLAAGAPALPIRRVSVVLPPGTTLAGVRAVLGDEIVIPGFHLPRPLAAPPDDTDSGGATQDITERIGKPDPVIYAAKTPFPAELAVPGGAGTMRGIALANVLVSPVRYVGATGELRLATRLEIHVDYAPAPAPLAAETRRRDPARARDTLERREMDWLVRHVANPGDFSRFYEPGARAAVGPDTPLPYAGFTPTPFPSTDGPPVEYVIVTDSVAVDGRPVGDLPAEFQRLADWKTGKGTPATIRTVSWIRAHYPGHDDPARIRAFLVDAFELWGTDYVLLGGDTRIVPGRRMNGISLGAGHPPADVYYGALDSSWDLDRDGVYGEPADDVQASDPYWDVWVGRAPVENRAEASIFVERTLQYARAPGVDLTGLDPGYYEKLLLMEGLANCPTWGLACNGLFVGETILRHLTPPQIARTRMYQRLLDPSPSCTYHQTYVETADSVQVQWTTSAAFNAIDAGVGFIHHYEHSNPYEEGGASGGFGCAVTSGGALGREYVDLLANGPNWSVMYSTGAGVNAFDYESVSEHWVLNPAGGAAAYIGKTRSGSIGNTTGEVDTLTFGNIFIAEMTIGQAMAIASQSVSTVPASAVASFGLLGDPDLKPWIHAPRTMSLTVTPPTFTPGDVLVTVTARDAASLDPIAGARVALVQGDRAYAYGLTGADGSVRSALVLPSPDAVAITATAPDQSPATATLEAGLTAVPSVVYRSHVAFDDSLGVANANGIADAGEVLKLDVTAENRGTATALGTTGELAVIGAVTLDVEIDGQCEPAAVFTGALDGHPDGAADCVLRFPADEFHGVSPHGRPAALPGSTARGLFVWRDGNRWHLVTRGAPAPAPPGTRFTGGLRVPGAHELLAAGALEPGDQWTAVGADSIAFDFTAQAAGDVDSLLFTARESAWVALPASTAAYGNLAPGASATGRFLAATTAGCPDRHEPRFELFARNAGGATVGRSSFALPVAAPVLAYARQDVAVAEGTGTILPVVRNAGSGVASSVRAVLRQSAGQATVTDSVVTFGAIQGNSESGTLLDVFVLAGTDTTTARFAVAIENRFPDGTERTWSPPAALDLTRPCPPAALAAEPTHGRSMRLSWTAPSTACAPDLAGYNIYRRLGAGPFMLVAGSGPDSTQSFQEVGLAPDTTWVFAVAARDSSGNESAWSNLATQATWIPELAGWPRAVDAGTPSSPLAVDVDGDGDLEIFILGNALYGWHADGTPVNAAHPDGTIFRPVRSLGTMTQGATGAFFGSPAAADLDHDGSMEIALAAWDDSLWVVDALSGTLRFGRPCVAKYSSPAIGDLDGDGDFEIVIGSDADTVYAWHHNGTAVNPAFPSGALARLPDGAIINYTTPALADIDANPLTVEVIYATFRGDVYAWNANGTLLWSCDVGPNRPLSTPAIGDVDEDGVLEAVVVQGNTTTGTAANALYILNAETGAIERSWSGDLAIPGNVFSPGNYIHPPSLADLDGNGDLEILAGTSGVTWPPPSFPLLGGATVLVFDHDRAQGYALACRDAIPLPGLNMTNVSQQNVNAQPIVADLDGDAGYEIAAGSTTFGLFLFEADPALASCTEEPGWPLLFSGEVEATPVVADVDRDGLLDLVVRAHDGEAHVFATGNTFEAAAVEWGQFGHDPRHTSSYTTPIEVGIPGSPAPTAPALALRQNAPNPFRPPTVIAYALPAASRARLAIYTVDGRLVRTLVDRIAPAGEHLVAWDGRDAAGREQPAGIYFYRLESPAGSATRKLALIR